jgi:metal-sulfur cluster biosynthetic enzyme
MHGITHIKKPEEKLRNIEDMEINTGQIYDLAVVCNISFWKIDQHKEFVRSVLCGNTQSLERDVN